MWLLRDFLRMSFFCCCATKQAQNSLKYFKLKFQSNSMFFFVCKDLTWLGCRRKKKKTARLSFFPLSAFRLRLIHIKKSQQFKDALLVCSLNHNLLFKHFISPTDGDPVRCRDESENWVQILSTNFTNFFTVAYDSRWAHFSIFYGFGLFKELKFQPERIQSFFLLSS